MISLGGEEEVKEWRRKVRQKERKKIIMTMVTLHRLAYALISFCIYVDARGEVKGEEEDDTAMTVLLQLQSNVDANAG